MVDLSHRASGPVEGSAQGLRMTTAGAAWHRKARRLDENERSWFATRTAEAPMEREPEDRVPEIECTRAILGLR